MELANWTLLAERFLHKDQNRGLRVEWANWTLLEFAGRHSTKTAAIGQ